MCGLALVARVLVALGLRSHSYELRKHLVASVTPTLHRSVLVGVNRGPEVSGPTGVSFFKYPPRPQRLACCLRCTLELSVGNEELMRALLEGFVGLIVGAVVPFIYLKCFLNISQPAVHKAFCQCLDKLERKYGIQDQGGCIFRNLGWREIVCCE